jgi:hypothetical protein
VIPTLSFSPSKYHPLLKIGVGSVLSFIRVIAPNGVGISTLEIKSNVT